MARTRGIAVVGDKVGWLSAVIWQDRYNPPIMVLMVLCCSEQACDSSGDVVTSSQCMVWIPHSCWWLLRGCHLVSPTFGIVLTVYTVHAHVSNGM